MSDKTCFFLPQLNHLNFNTTNHTICSLYKHIHVFCILKKIKKNIDKHNWFFHNFVREQDI